MTRAILSCFSVAYDILATAEITKFLLLHEIILKLIAAAIDMVLTKEQNSKIIMRIDVQANCIKI